MEAGAHSSRSVQRDDSRSSLSRYYTETKASFKTSEFWLTIAVIAGILISAMQIKGGPDDEFGASQAWLYVAILTGLYAVGRGAAKSGSREPYGVDRDGDVRSNSGN